MASPVPTVATAAASRHHGGPDDAGHSPRTMPPPPVKPNSFPALLDAARQQTELVVWVAQALNDHEERLESLAEGLAVLRRAEDAKASWQRRRSRAGTDGVQDPGVSRSTTGPLLKFSRARTATGLSADENVRLPFKGEVPAAAAPTASDAAAAPAAPVDGDAAAPLVDAAAAPIDAAAALVDAAPGVEAGDAATAATSERGEQQVEASVSSVSPAELEQAMAATERALQDLSSDFERRMDECVDFLQGRLSESELEVNTKLEPLVSKIAAERISALRDELMASIEDQLASALALGADKSFMEDVSDFKRDVSGADSEAAGDHAVSRARTKSDLGLGAVTPTPPGVASDVGETAAPAASDDLIEERPPSVRSVAVSRTASKREAAEGASSAILNAKLARVATDVVDLKAIVDEVRQQLPSIDEHLTALKPLRLQIPSFRLDIDELAARISNVEVSVQDAMSKDNRGSSATPGSAPDAVEALPSMHRASIAEIPDASAVADLQAEFAAATAAVADATAGYESLSGQVKDMGEKGDKLERDLKATQPKLREFEQLLSMLEERLKDVETNYNQQQKKLQLKLNSVADKCEAISDQDLRSAKTWNLAEQVDMIQSIIKQEMKAVRYEVDQLVRSQMADGTQFAGTGRGASKQAGRAASKTMKDRSPSPQSTPAVSLKQVEEVETKVKKLQEVVQQCVLKIAGVKSAGKQWETNIKFLLDRNKKMFNEVDQLVEISQRNEKAIEYLAMHVRQAVSGSTAGLGTLGSTDSLNSEGSAAIQLHLPGGGNRSAQGPRRLGAGKKRSPSVVEENSINAAEDGPLGAPRSHENSDDVNTIRFGTMAKRISDLDIEMHSQIAAVRQLVDNFVLGTNMIISYLPRRQRRLVERFMHQAATSDIGPDDDNEDKANEKSDKSAGGKKQISFSEKPPETRTFDVVTDTQMPWQVAGEVDPKWSWCFNPKNDMGGDLARHLELQEAERAEFEADMQKALQQLRDEMQTIGALRRRPVGASGRGSTVRGSQVIMSSGAGAAHELSALEEDGESGDACTAQLDGISEKPSIPQRMGISYRPHPELGIIEDNLERTVFDLQDLKRKVEQLSGTVVHQDQLELLTMRVAKFDRFDPAAVDARFDKGERESKHFVQLLDHITELVRKIEGTSAQKSEVARLRTELVALRSAADKTDTEVKEASSAMFVSNRKIAAMLTETKTHVESKILALEREKASSAETVLLQERMLKIEVSMRDNRALLGEAGVGHELSAVVKRIILNLEDKIMVLEKKVNALVDCAPAALASLSQDAAWVLRPTQGESAAPSPRGRDDAEQAAAAEEISAMSSVIQQLKQEIGLRRAEIEHLVLQSRTQNQLVDRLQVVVHSVASKEDDEGTALSMARVQVMISAAARHLLAGNHWVTREGFDDRFGEARKEYLGSIRQLQMQVEDIQDTLAKAGSPISGAVTAMSGARLPRVLALGGASPGPTKTLAGHDWPPKLASTSASPGGFRERGGHLQPPQTARPRTSAGTSGGGAVGLFPEALGLRRPRTQGAVG
eukprot:TRINITY_DN2457_c0_g1_i1.p1 TRINITY_DN2457_c0_g1~~TRINITY_DN2457_c0_g1_i1.p1  ORF type:complete len:1544 (-),score=363.19 TRINITY_DN2457_c0_g1_i1:108-4712(-)